MINSKLKQTHYTKEEFSELEQCLIDRGYKKHKLDQEDYTYGKSFGESELDGERSNYQVFFKVYDFSKYPQHSRRDSIGVELIISISRTINERVDIVASYQDIKDVTEAELFGSYMFNQYVKFYNKR